MPTTGYWVECVPIYESSEKDEYIKYIDDSENLGTELTEIYSASIPSLPEAKAFARSPDVAINKLKRKLKHLRRYYELMEKPLPKSHNPIRPPKRLRDIPGWVSVYIEMEYNSSNE